MKPKFRRIFPSLVVSGPARILSLSFMASLAAHGASGTWNGTADATWANGANWSAAAAPGAGEAAAFSNAGNGNTTLDLGAGVTVGSIQFDATAVSYTLGSGAAGSQSLALGAAGSISNAGPAQLINANLNLPTDTAAVATLANNGTGVLTLAGTVAAVPPAGESLLTVTGTGNTAITGAVTETGAGNSALLKTGTGTLTLSNGSAFSGAGASGNIPNPAGFPIVIREGTLQLAGGTHSVTGELVIGGVVAHGGAGQNAKVQVDGGTLAISSWFSVGRGNGIGGVSSDVVANNDAIITAANLSGGFNGGNALNIPKGSITLNGTSSLSVSNLTNWAESPGTAYVMNLNDTSTFRQTANANETRVGTGDTAVGTINVNGGTATFERDLILGYTGSGTGNLVLNSGTVNVANATERWLIVGRANTASGNITVNGGNLNLNANTDLRFSTVNTSTGTSTVTLAGGAITGGVSSIVDLKQNTGAGGLNTFNLNGGTLTISQVLTTQNTATAATVFNFNGGLLKATAASANFVDLGGTLQRANIRNGGAVIDSNGFNLTIPEPLRHSDVGGDNAIDGGLTKNGAGILTLAGANTFTGPIALNQGGLVLGGSYPGAFTLAAGTSLTVAEPAVPIGTLTVGNLTVGDGVTLSLETGAANAGEKIVAANFTHGTVGINLYAQGTATPASPGTYTLFQYSGTLTGGTTGLSILNQRAGYTYNFANTGSAITVEVVSLDADGDGMTDSYEIANGLNPNDDGTIGETSPGAKDGPNGALGNIDGDFSNNYAEFLAGTAANNAAADPNNVDNDGLPDNWEVTHFGDTTSQSGASDFDGDFDSNLAEYTAGTDATLATSFTDADADGLSDGWEIQYFGSIAAKDGSADSDGDLFTDAEEYKYGSDPVNSSFSPAFAKPAHRWSFTGNLNDSIGTSHATIQNGTASGLNVVTQNADSVKLAGGPRADSQWVKLGNNLMPGHNTPVTVELWATMDVIRNFSRIFDFQSGDFQAGQFDNLYMSWSFGTTAFSDRVQWLDGVNAVVDNTNLYGTATKYHIVMTVQPSPTTVGSSLVKWYSAQADGVTELGAAKGSFTIATSVSKLNDSINALGYSAYGGDNTASATYDEVRIWDGALPLWALHGLHQQGPDDPAQADTDNDKLPDAFEMYYFQNLDKGPNDDSDGDLTSNLKELLAGSNPADPASSPNDSDSDGLPDAWELSYFGNLSQDGTGDPDGDYAYNSEELAAVTNPTLYTSFPDADHDGMSDGWETIFLPDPVADNGTRDDDGDGFNSLAEFTAKSNPSDPLSPGAPDGDGDNDGLPDRWEVAIFGGLSTQNGVTDFDLDGSSDLQEYRATSDPMNALKTPADINGDGTPDQHVFLDMNASGTGVLDKDSQATPFTKRLSVLPAVSTIPAVDPNLDLDTTAGTLALTTTSTDINGQVNVAQLEALGIPLSSLGFTGSNDFRIRAHYINMPALAGFDQIGIYVGTSSSQMTRASVFGANYQGLGVNTNGTNDSNATFAANGTAGKLAGDVTVIIERIGGVWAMTCNGNACNPGVLPTFLDGLAALEAGVFVLDQNAHKAAILESFSAVSFGSAGGAAGDADGDGMDDAWETLHFGGTTRDGTGDFDNDGVSDFAESAFNGNPSSGSSTGAGSSSLADTNSNGTKELTFTIAVRAGATFAAGANGSQVATVAGITYTVRGSANLAAFDSAVSHVGKSAASDPAYELHTFRLDSSEGLVGKGFLQAVAAKP